MGSLGGGSLGLGKKRVFQEQGKKSKTKTIGPKDGGKFGRAETLGEGKEGQDIKVLGGIIKNRKMKENHQKWKET